MDEDLKKLEISDQPELAKRENQPGVPDFPEARRTCDDVRENVALVYTGKPIDHKAERIGRITSKKQYWNKNKADKELLEANAEIDRLVEANLMDSENAEKEKLRYLEKYQKEKMAAVILAAEDFVAANPKASADQVFTRINEIFEGNFNSFQRELIERALARFRKLIGELDGTEKVFSDRYYFYDWKTEMKSKNKALNWDALKLENLKVARHEIDCLSIYVKSASWEEFAAKIGANGFYNFNFPGLIFIKDVGDEAENIREHELQHHRFREYFASVDKPISKKFRNIFDDRVVPPIRTEVQQVHAEIQNESLDELASYCQGGNILPTDTEAYFSSLKYGRSKFLRTPQGHAVFENLSAAIDELNRLIDAGQSRQYLASRIRVCNSLRELVWNLKQIK